MIDYIKELLNEQNIFCFAPIGLSDCKVVRPYLLQTEGIADGTAFIIAVPYYTELCDGKRNISAYAVSRDYHGYFKQLFANILPKLKEKYRGNKFAGFADHSPIAEVEAAARAGLGIIGDNHMLITEKYSSYVFLGEIITDISIEVEAKEITYCEHCGICMSECPYNKGECSECLSAVTQKKGELTQSEKSIMKKYGYAWGCDICQETCPHTISAIKSGSIYSPIEYFRVGATPLINKATVEKMSADEFSLIAYSWRGKETILRNLSLFETVEDIVNGE